MTMRDSLICSAADLPYLERTRFFPRQLVTPDDLTQDQLYFRSKLRRHNRLLHGWGVVCGCLVKPAPVKPGEPPGWKVAIEPGYALSAQGDEILVDQEIVVDLSREGMDGNAITSCGELDPWCSSVTVARNPNTTVFVAVAYAECQSRPVQAHPAGCSCDGIQCEYSRIREGFVVRVLETLPAGYATIQNPPPATGFFPCPPTGVRECPNCFTDPWVVLAAVTLRGVPISRPDINNNTYRRYVASFGSYWFTCGTATLPPFPATVTKAAIIAAAVSTAPTPVSGIPVLIAGTLMIAPTAPLSAGTTITVTIPAGTNAQFLQSAPPTVTVAGAGAGTVTVVPGSLTARSFVLAVGGTGLGAGVTITITEPMIPAGAGGGLLMQTVSTPGFAPFTVTAIAPATGQPFLVPVGGAPAPTFVQPQGLTLAAPAGLNPDAQPIPAPLPVPLPPGVREPIIAVFPEARVTCTLTPTPAPAAPGQFEISVNNGRLIDAGGTVSTNLRIHCGGADVVVPPGAAVNPNTCSGVQFILVTAGPGLVEIRARYEPDAAAAAAGIVEQETIGVVLVIRRS